MTATAAGAGPFGIDAAGEGGEGAVLQLPVAGTGAGWLIRVTMAATSAISVPLVDLVKYLLLAGKQSEV